MGQNFHVTTEENILETARLDSRSLNRKEKHSCDNANLVDLTTSPFIEAGLNQAHSNASSVTASVGWR